MKTKLEKRYDSKRPRARSMPADLSKVVGTQNLLKLTFEAVQQHQPLPQSGGQRPRFRSEMLLTLLTYSYSVGLYSSQDIETAMRGDRVIRYISAGSHPDWRTLRRFRREHRDMLQQALLYLMKQVWAFRFDSGEADYVGYEWFEAELLEEFKETVALHLDIATLLDGADED